MKKLDELNERLARLDEKLDQLEKNYKSEVEALNDEKSMLEEVIAMVTAFLSEANESFNTLCIAHASGGITTGDLKTYADKTSLEIPVELAADEEASEETKLEAVPQAG